MTIAVVPGTFDPVTNGHIDVIERAAAQFDHIVVACLRNAGKHPLFDPGERVELLEAACGHLANVEVAAFEGLLVDFCRDRGITIAIKGLRAVSDFESELQQAQMNKRLGGVETMFITTNPNYSYVSSSLVKEVARFGGDIADFVPTVVADRLVDRLG